MNDAQLRKDRIVRAVLARQRWMRLLRAWQLDDNETPEYGRRLRAILKKAYWQYERLAGML